MSDRSFPEPVPWNGDEPPEPRSKALKYRCLDCSWSGLAEGAITHHREDHHRIVARDAPQWGTLTFSCCVPSLRCDRDGCDRALDVFRVTIDGLGTFCSRRCAKAQQAALEQAS
jgi:hypothetical protein